MDEIEKQDVIGYMGWLRKQPLLKYSKSFEAIKTPPDQGVSHASGRRTT